MTSTTDREARIRERAHRIWESEGRPDDRAEVHWSIAARIVDEEDAAVVTSESDAVDEGSIESFPASDPPAIVQPITSVKADDTAQPANDAAPPLARKRRR
ncbi:DUF2934 domain-containing protein [Chthonobacter rhizosphaerae]|uniref:DUF2934 domain-containing protein n=1 Tax=Chthonobacter rhizosphaerae TaxID=2735553 RepID=UPI0015EE5E93|nr:DUF2934 domain-containing protein [Chthonobacter rhizosphaerae]